MTSGHCPPMYPTTPLRASAILLLLKVTLGQCIFSSVSLPRHISPVIFLCFIQYAIFIYLEGCKHKFRGLHHTLSQWRPLQVPASSRPPPEVTASLLAVSSSLVSSSPPSLSRCLLFPTALACAQHATTAYELSSPAPDIPFAPALGAGPSCIVMPYANGSTGGWCTRLSARCLAAFARRWARIGSLRRRVPWPRCCCRSSRGIPL